MNEEGRSPDSGGATGAVEQMSDQGNQNRGKAQWRSLAPECPARNWRRKEVEGANFGDLKLERRCRLPSAKHQWCQHCDCKAARPCRWR